MTYLTNITVPVTCTRPLVSRSKYSISHTYTPVGWRTPLKLPSHPSPALFVEKSKTPSRL